MKTKKRCRSGSVLILPNPNQGGTKRYRFYPCCGSETFFFAPLQIQPVVSVGSRFGSGFESRFNVLGWIYRSGSSIQYFGRRQTQLCILHMCRWCTLICKSLRELSKKFERVLMGYSGAGGKLIHEKNQKLKSHDTVPLNSYGTELYV